MEENDMMVMMIRDEHRLRFLYNALLRRIFEPQRENVREC
jgi:hypothetical protein